MVKIITATNNSNLNKELSKEKNVQVLYKDIFYREGILEILEKNIEIDYIIIDENLSGEIELNNLIEKIFEKNKNIKIIITIKKENKKKININNSKIIKIFYEGKINLEKIKKNNNKIEKINIKNIDNKKDKIFDLKKLKQKFYAKQKEKNVNCKMISIFGERQIGKSIFAIILAYYLKSKNCKILLVELNEENPSFYSIFGCKKLNKKRWKKKKKIRKNRKKERKTFVLKYMNKNVLENMIIHINENIDVLSYNKLINFNFINTIKYNYNYLIIENYFKKNKAINKKIINNSNKNILIINPNLLGIKNSKKIIEKNKINKNNNLKILINNFNKFSVNDEVIKNIFKGYSIIGKVKHQNLYEDLINKNFYNIKNKKIINVIEKNININSLQK